MDRPPYMETWRDLAADKSMVFLAGPRQAGKTTLAGMIALTYTSSLYSNWDIPDHRTRMLGNPRFFESVERKDRSAPLVVLDEIHKRPDWKNYLKGVYDEFKGQYQFLVSGSGRLDLFQRRGDSLAGRYLLFHLWPITVAEMGGRSRRWEEFARDPLWTDAGRGGASREAWRTIREMSGFPEPFLSARQASYRRWTNTYSMQLIREDVRDLTGIRSIGGLETLYDLLPTRVGSPLSIPSLSSDLKVSYNTVAAWLEVFRRFFLVIGIAPWTRQIARAISKERKVYVLDVPRVKDPAARFENMVALELWRAVTTWTERGYGKFSLHFVRNKQKQEVDFLIAAGGEPMLLVEAKLSDTEPSAPLRKFQSALGVPAVQLVEEGAGFRSISNGDRQITVAPAWMWLSGLP